MANMCAKSEVSSLSHSRAILLKIYKGSHDVTPFRDLLWPMCTPNLKSLCFSTMKIWKAITKVWKAMQNVEMGWFGV